jgi:ABC-type multidrug transport system fused ATPase/permease subunit
MVRAAIFPSFLKPKESKLKLVFIVFKNIVKRNLGLFLFNAFLAVAAAIVSFNVRLCLKESFKIRPENLTFLDKKYSLIFRPFKGSKEVGFWPFIWTILLLFAIGRIVLSLLHYYWMNYAYDRVENELKKDLFNHFIQAKYSNSTQVSKNLLTQFGLLDRISRVTWFIANRFFYILTTLIFLLKFDFLDPSKMGNPTRFVLILIFLFTITFAIQFFLFKKAAKLSVEAKQRYEEENRHIFERINNLEYIKVTSGENYEQQKLEKLIDHNFEKNRKSLLWSVLFRGVPSQVLVPSLSLLFILLTGISTLAFFWPISPAEELSFFVPNFALIWATVSDLRYEMDKIIQSGLELDDLSSDLTLVLGTINTLYREKKTLVSTQKNLLPFENGDIEFTKVNFAYPTRPSDPIIQDFSFRFEQGKKYGIVGKNGIGKSTITKTLLKLYDIQKGEITINEKNVQEIDTKNLHHRVCYLTNRPGFFKMSITKNVLYPFSDNQELNLKQNQTRLVQAAEKTGIKEFIESLPNGFQTELKEKGSDLSEGQKQQIATMRVFIQDYDIYIFDEILSNVQKDLKAQILINIFACLKNKTVLVIDHHYDIFQHVDSVYQFTGERLIEINKDMLIK